MKFTAKIGKAVVVGSKILRFKSTIYETTDKAEIAALQGAKNVKQVKDSKASEK